MTRPIIRYSTCAALGGHYCHGCVLSTAFKDMIMLLLLLLLSAGLKVGGLRGFIVNRKIKALLSR